MYVNSQTVTFVSFSHPPSVVQRNLLMRSICTCVSLQRARNYILERLMNRLQNVLEHRPLDMERIDFICTQDMVLLSALSESLDGPDV